MNPLLRYSLKRMQWYFLTLIFAVFLNFYLPRLVPGNPVSMIVGQMAEGGVGSEALREMYNTFMREFGLDLPLWQQFINYVGQLLRGDLGTSFGYFPRSVSSILRRALPWTVALQLPAMLVGWIVGNALGAIAAYKRGVFDSTVLPSALFMSAIPHYALGLIILYLLAVAMGWFPVGGGYSHALRPALNWVFIRSALHHYILPFMSIVLVTIGGQAIGMREMSIYELQEDYVLYCRSLGIRESKIVRYVFKNAVLPQITGLALTLGMVVGGSLVTEIVFSYPGVGTYLFNAIRQADYPLVQGITLIVAVAVLLANFIMDITYGLIDPRIKSAQFEEGSE